MPHVKAQTFACRESGVLDFSVPEGALTTSHLQSAILRRARVVMTTIFARLLLWSPRLLGVLVSLFVGLFAIDAFGRGKPFLEALPDFGIHLIPAFVLLALVGAFWRREWIGGVAFIGLAVLYAITTGRSHLDWMVVISCPLLIVGALFLWSWLHHSELHAS
jgi:hypothetical protein